MRWLVAAGVFAFAALLWLLRRLVEADSWHDSTTDDYGDI